MGRFAPHTNLSKFLWWSIAVAILFRTFLWTRGARPQKCPRPNCSGGCYTSPDRIKGGEGGSAPWCGFYPHTPLQMLQLHIQLV
jgi:hypothetical protein